MKMYAIYCRVIRDSLFFTILVLVGCSESIIVENQKDISQDRNVSNNAYFKKSFELMALIENQTDLLFTIASKMPPAKNGEWRYYWNQPEQSPDKYITSMPNRVSDENNTLYIKPMGDFANDDYVLLQKIAGYLEINFQTPVIVLDKSNDFFPNEAVRRNRQGDEQLSSVHITDVILKEEMPDDAWGILAVTPNDIYRAEGIDKLYGDSLIFGKRGVISLYHLKSSNNTQSLSLALKGASHETSHLLSLPHCSVYKCNMNGRITIEEFIQAPLYYSPDCLSKLIFSTGGNIKKRFSDLIIFCRENNLKSELDYYTRALKIIENQ